MAELECLVLMPFEGSFDPVMETIKQAMEKAVPGTAIRCRWLKDVHSAGQITDDIVEGIRKSAICISDLSGTNPNVMWETGYAMAAGKPTILICQDISMLPFDLKVHRVHEYSLENLVGFKEILAEATRQTLSRYNIRTVTTKHDTDANPLVVAVTGSMEIEPARARRRIETILAPYHDCVA